MSLSGYHVKIHLFVDENRINKKVRMGRLNFQLFFRFRESLNKPFEFATFFGLIKRLNRAVNTDFTSLPS